MLRLSFLPPPSHYHHVAFLTPYIYIAEGGISDMETTRQRKDREFQRLQRNLMELLAEQKDELDRLRKKGIELETATAIVTDVAIDALKYLPCI